MFIIFMIYKYTFFRSQAAMWNLCFQFVRSQEGQAYRLLANCLDKLNASEEERNPWSLTDGNSREDWLDLHQKQRLVFLFNHVLT